MTDDEGRRMTDDGRRMTKDDGRRMTKDDGRTTDNGERVIVSSCHLTLNYTTQQSPMHCTKGE
jgi:hypothetical protein